MKDLIKQLIIKIDLEKFKHSLKDISLNVNEQIYIKKKELLNEILNNEDLYKYHIKLYKKEIIEYIQELKNI